MFCSNCGAQAAGNFCSSCGTRLQVVVAERICRIDWQHEHRYQTLLQSDTVRDLIAQHAAQSRTRVSAEEFMKLCDEALKPLTGVSLELVAKLAMPIYTSLGVQTGKTESRRVALPVGQAIVATICFLTRNGQSLRRVHQGADGCVLEAELPSDIWSWKGEFVVAVKRDGGAAQLEAATKIPGQVFDWGKSKQQLGRFFEEINSFSP